MDSIIKIIYKIGGLILHKIAKKKYQRKIKKIGLGYFGKHTQLGFPSLISNPSQVYLYEYSRLQQNHIIYNYTGNFIMKEYSGASIGLVVVTGNHIPTVGIPQFMLGITHINDKETDIIVEEDVWIGARVTLIAGAHIGRGAIVGANSLVNKEIPPYAVVVGSPAKIIASKFTIDQIIEHEKRLYVPEKRFSRKYLEALFQDNYMDKKHLGMNTDLSKTDFEKYAQKFDFKYLNTISAEEQ